MVVMMKGILIVLLVLLLGNVILLYLLAPRLSGRRRVHPFFGVKWAHRGLHDIKKGIPENSIPAFQAAIEAGYGIELDVHLTKDGKLNQEGAQFYHKVCKCAKENQIELFMNLYHFDMPT